MKIRNGFVSNSSSSSFIVGFPKGLTRKEKIVLVLDKMGVRKNDFFSQAGKEVADCIVDADKMTLDEVADDHGYDSWQSMTEKHEGNWEKNIVNTVSRCQEKGLQIYSGSASNESYDPGENLFCDIEWEVDDENFFIWKERGF